MFKFHREQVPASQSLSAERAFERVGEDPEVLAVVQQLRTFQFGGRALNDAALIEQTEAELTNLLAVRGVVLSPTESSAGFDDTIPTFLRQFDTPAAP